MERGRRRGGRRPDQQGGGGKKSSDASGKRGLDRDRGTLARMGRREKASAAEIVALERFDARRGVSIRVIEHGRSN